MLGLHHSDHMLLALLRMAVGALHTRCEDGGHPRPLDARHAHVIWAVLMA